MEKSGYFTHENQPFEKKIKMIICFPFSHWNLSNLFFAPTSKVRYVFLQTSSRLPVWHMFDFQSSYPAKKQTVNLPVLWLYV